MFRVISRIQHEAIIVIQAAQLSAILMLTILRLPAPSLFAILAVVPGRRVGVHHQGLAPGPHLQRLSQNHPLEQADLAQGLDARQSDAPGLVHHLADVLVRHHLAGLHLDDRSKMVA